MKTAPFDPVKHLDNPGVIRAYVEEQQAYVRQLLAEIEEPARLNGMGAERELALRAEVERLRRDNQVLGNIPQEALNLMTAELRAEVERLRQRIAELEDPHYLKSCETERDQLRTVLRALVERMDQVHQDPAYVSVWTLHQIHGGQYRGPTYTKELDEARHALKEK